jgi:hypothetical protein
LRGSTSAPASIRAIALRLGTSCNTPCVTRRCKSLRDQPRASRRRRMCSPSARTERWAIEYTLSQCARGNPAPDSGQNAQPVGQNDRPHGQGVVGWSRSTA